MIKRINPGTRMSDVLVHNGVAYLAGKVPSKGVVGIQEQTRDVLTTIDRLLAEVGTERTKILRAEIYLANIADFEQMNAVWDAWIAGGPGPARATVETRLANPDFRIEIVITAAI